MGKLNVTEAFYSERIGLIDVYWIGAGSREGQQ